MAGGLIVCAICKSNNVMGESQGLVTYYSCPRCGAYGILEACRHKIDRWDIHKRRKLLRHLQKPLSDQNTYVIDDDSEALLAKFVEPKRQERLAALMRIAINRTPTVGESFGQAADAELIRVSLSFSSTELAHLLDHLKTKELVTYSSGNWYLTLEGIDYFEPRGAAGYDPAQAFVAMSFGVGMSAVYANAIEPAIAAAGFRPLRIDRKEHVNKIDDEIISEIRRSRLIVADFTENKAGVYFEAGFALGLSIPVIWTCMRDDLPKLHFDIRQFNCIDWADEMDLFRRLQKRITAVVGYGPHYIVAEGDSHPTEAH